MTEDSAGWLGQELAGGRYWVVARLGEGGMGVVYKARDRNLDTDVVVKVPRRALLQDKLHARRFAREVRSLVRLAHPFIVKILDVGRHEGQPFAVMQYLAGGNRDDRRRGPDGRPAPLPPTSLRGWLENVAGALDFIHAQGHVPRSSVSGGGPPTGFPPGRRPPGRQAAQH